MTTQIRGRIGPQARCGRLRGWRCRQGQVRRAAEPDVPPVLVTRGRVSSTKPSTRELLAGRGGSGGQGEQRLGSRERSCSPEMGRSPLVGRGTEMIH